MDELTPEQEKAIMAELEKKYEGQKNFLKDIKAAINKESGIIKELEKLQEANKDNTEQYKLIGEAINKTEIELAKQVDKEGGILGIAGKKIEDDILKFNEVDKSIRKMGVSFGVTKTELNLFKEQMIPAQLVAYTYGYSLEDLVVIQDQLQKSTHNLAVVSRSGFEDIIKTTKSLGLELSQTIEMVNQLQEFGYGISETADFSEKIFQTAREYGIGAKKLFEGISENLKNSQKYATYKNGKEDLIKMVAEAQKLKMSMEDTYAFSNKMRQVDTAFETIAQMQLLGGEFAKLDLFEMLNLARNDMAGFQKKVQETAKDMAMLSENGELIIPPENLDTIRKYAEYAGMSADKFAESTIQIKKMEMLKDLNVSPELMNIAEKFGRFGLGGKVTVATGSGVEKDINQLTPEDIKYFTDKNADINAESKGTLTDQLATSQNIYESVKHITKTLETIAYNTAGIAALSGTLPEGMNKFITQTYTDLGKNMHDTFTNSTDTIQHLEKISLDSIQNLFSGALSGIKDTAAGAVDRFKSMTGMGAGGSPVVTPAAVQTTGAPGVYGTATGTVTNPVQSVAKTAEVFNFAPSSPASENLLKSSDTHLGNIVSKADATNVYLKDISDTLKSFPNNQFVIPKTDIVNGSANR